MQNDEKLSIERIEHDYEQFTNICSEKNDPVLNIIRFHLLMEYHLEQIIILELRRGDRLIYKGNLSYSQKINLVDSFDVLKDKLIQCLKNLNKVRNSCAHKFSKTITISDVEKIGRPLGKEFMEIKREYINNLNKLIYGTLVIICASISNVIISLEKDLIRKRDNNKKNQ